MVGGKGTCGRWPRAPDRLRPPPSIPQRPGPLILVNATNWPTQVVIESGRAVTLESADPGAPATIDFGSMDDHPVVVVASGGELTLSSVVVRGLGALPADTRFPYAPALPFAVSIASYPGSTLSVLNSTAYVATASCDTLAPGSALGAAAVLGGADRVGGAGAVSVRSLAGGIVALGRQEDVTHNVTVLVGNGTKSKKRGWWGVDGLVGCWRHSTPFFFSSSLPSSVGNMTVREAYSLYLCAPGNLNGRWPVPFPEEAKAPSPGAVADAPPPPRDLPPGAVAGIFIAAAALALLLVCAVALLVAGRRRRPAPARSGEEGESLGAQRARTPPTTDGPDGQTARWVAAANGPWPLGGTSSHASLAEGSTEPSRAPPPAPPLAPAPPSLLARASPSPNQSRHASTANNWSSTEDGRAHGWRQRSSTTARAAAPAAGLALAPAPPRARTSTTAAATLTLPDPPSSKGPSPPDVSVEPSLTGSAWPARRVGPPGAADAVRMGPIVGRGSFGVVRKARWCGGLVALKIVALTPHAAAAAATVVGVCVAGGSAGDGGEAPPPGEMTPASAAVGDKVARELTLGVSLSHPNLVATYRAWIVRGDAARGRAAAAHGRAAAAPGGASCESASCGAGTGVAMGTAPGGAPALVDADDPAAAVPAVVEGGDGVASAAAAVTAAFDDYRAAALDASEPREAWLLLEFCGGGTLDAALRSARFGVPGTPAAARAALVTLADIAAGMEYLHAHSIA